MHVFVVIWQYAHDHWQDNVIASAIWAIPAALYARMHVKRLHHKLDRIHKHLGIDKQ